MLQESLEDRGLRFVLGAHTQALLGNEAGRVCAVQLQDGSCIDADLVVMAVGIRPNTELAERMGLHCQRGIVVTDTLQTVTDPRVYAVGECVNHRGVAYGLVAPLFEQSKVCANHLAHFGIGRYAGSQVSTKLKVTGIDLFSAGDFQGGDGCEQITLADPTAGIYKKLVIRDDRLVGACLYGDTVDGGWYFKLMREGRNITDLREHLMFGEANLGDSGHQGQNRALAMADGDEVCGCNGITKGAIVTAIRQDRLCTLEEVRRCTKASSSCGSCTGLVEQILIATAGADYSASPRSKPMCGCTDSTHEQVRQAIRDQRLLTIPDVVRVLNWRTPNGCASCRPAINYYLISTWPGQARDDPQSRFINERAHANIQRDGTFSVVPRIWGGETSAAELRRIADVVDKYRIPTVKVTGGQRIDLLGVRKQDLPAVWRDLGMPSGHAYAKALRTVKTCVGSEWCRFGTQDSTAMGKALERALWRMYAPHKVKLAVSGCPRNCAECGIKDVGVIGVDSGWEIYVAGNGGIKTEVAQFLVKVATAQEVLEHAGAFLQLYREQGWYLERTVHYVARVGLDHVKARVVIDAASRRALWERLQFALADEPDPWHEPERAHVDARQFVPIRAVEPVEG
jgi:nitrite reductase (NADH) large subunit